ncbi:hypothetical protein D3C71_78310 [compost metagenome]
MTDQTTSAGQAETDDDILNYVHGKRKQIVEGILPEVMAATTDPKNISLALQALDGMSRDALGRKRLQVEEKGANASGTAGAIIAQMLRQATGLRPFEVDVPTQRPPVELGADVPRPVLVAGETDTVAPQGNYESFTNVTRAG